MSRLLDEDNAKNKRKKTDKEALGPSERFFVLYHYPDLAPRLPRETGQSRCQIEQLG